MIILKVNENNVFSIKNKANTIEEFTDIDNAIAHTKEVIAMCFYDYHKEEFISQTKAMKILEEFDKEKLSDMFGIITAMVMAFIIGLDQNEIPLVPIQSIDIKYDSNRISSNVCKFVQETENDTYFRLCMMKYILAKSLYDNYSEEYIPEDQLELVMKKMVNDGRLGDALKDLRDQMEIEMRLDPYTDFLNNLNTEL